MIASGALYYHGTQPVNVAVFVAVTVGVQWLLLAWTLLVVLSRGVRTASQHMLARLGEAVGQALASALGHLSGEQRMRLRAELATLRQLTGRNLQLLCWPPLLALQNFGVCWNLGVLLALLARVSFTDVAFGWQSTLAHGPNGMYALARGLAAPWVWCAPGACPTLDQIERSWFHFRTGVAALDPSATAAWWPWLVGIILVYGLFPRVALRIYFGVQLSLGLKKLSFDEPRHRAAWLRLTGPVIHSNRTTSDGALSPGDGGVPHAVPRAEAGCLLIASPLAEARAEIEQWVTKQLGWRLPCSEVVEIDYPSGNDAALGRLATALAQAPRWLVAVPAPFTAFSAFTQFLERIDGAATSPASLEGFVLVVALDAQGKLQAPDAEWTRYWHDFLRAESSGCATLAYTP